LEVDLPDELCRKLSDPDVQALREALSLDPRPHYHDDASREYGMPFMGYDIRFRVNGNRLTVLHF
jgi:hypothetical protein